jgi:glycosyltransferase involved in cell wall biosynthesis
MSGKPLISAEVGSGTSHINIQDLTGLVIPPGCPEALREAMDKLYYNPRLACQMGSNARQRYEELFTGKTMGARYTEVYRRVVLESAEPAGLVSGNSGVS